nr:transketolase [bacterium]
MQKELLHAVDEKAINTLRVLSAEAIEKAKSGHPGLPMGAAPMAWTLFSRHLSHDPSDAKWDNRDRFVLSAGHGSMLLYSLLHIFGYGLEMEDLKQFRQLGSKTPGHPEYGHTVGVEMTTGPLGQGLATAVGMAAAETRMAAHFNRPGHEIVDHYTYVIAGDGCMMEGISYEAASLAGTWKLGKLIVLYDSNNISIEGSTDIAFTENVAARFAALGWQTLRVEDGTDVEAISMAISVAKACTDKPSMIEIKTHIGQGCPAKQGKASAHGEPLGADNLAETKKTLGWDLPPFTVPQEVYQATAQLQEEGAKRHADWNAAFKAYEAAFPELAAEYTRWMSGQADLSFLSKGDYWAFEGSQATRNTSGEVLNRLAPYVPNLMGGAADLTPSTKSNLKGFGDYGPENRDGANIHFGVRELAMAAITNGLALHGGLRPYCATFFVFSDYMKPVIRLSALMNLPVLFILTHDSIGVGEDGPTHQPIEQLAMLRSIPGVTVFRPADGPETAAAYAYAMQNGGPVALALTRQNLPTLQASGIDAMRGGYLISSGGKQPDILLMATGSEVHLIIEAAKKLEEMGIHARVISMPSLDVFDRQPEAYKETVLPCAVRARLAVEAGSSMGWHKYVGLDGDVVCMEGFGASGPANRLFEHFGLTVDHVVERALAVVDKNKQKA